MHRGLSAACASVLTCLVTYPLETKKSGAILKYQVNNLYAGMVPELGGKFISTGVYFSVYEHMYTGQLSSVPMSTAFAVSSSMILSTSTNIIKERNRAHKNNKIVPYFTLKSWLNTYCTSIIPKIPKNILKYIVYEFLLKSINIKSNALCGGIAAFISTVVATTIFMPLEILKTYNSLGLQWNIQKQVKQNGLKTLMYGYKQSLYYSVISNSIGHTFLEFFSPRNL